MITALAAAAGVVLNRAISSAGWVDMSINSSFNTPSMPCSPA